MPVVENFYFRSYLYSEFSGTVRGVAAKIQYLGLEKCLLWVFSKLPPYVQLSLTTDCLVIFLLGSLRDKTNNA